MKLCMQGIPYLLLYYIQYRNMFGGNSLFVFIVTLTSAVIEGNYVPEFCGGNVVTHDPPIEARQVFFKIVNLTLLFIKS